jgi:signal transduction histidine kinase
VDPNRLPLNPVPPPVLIETIRSSDSLYAAGPELLRLAARERDLRFRYTGLSYKIPERVRFRTRLEGYDAEWQEAGTNREAVYTNLPHGRFAFRVTACNNDNIWNNEGAAQIVVIRPFWYETWWAYCGYVLLSWAFLVWAVRRYYRRQFLTQQLKLHTEHATKLEELNEARSRFFAGISHEFRTPLTLISGPLEELIHQEKDKGKSAVYAMMLRNTRRLLALVKQLLDLAQIQSGKMALQAQPLEIAVLLKEIIASFESWPAVAISNSRSSSSRRKRVPTPAVGSGRCGKTGKNLCQSDRQRGQITPGAAGEGDFAWTHRGEKSAMYPGAGRR